MSHKKHYTDMDRQIFLGVLKKFSHIVENKKNDASSLKVKEDAWQQITEQYNDSTVISCKRTVAQLKKMWSNMKSVQRNNLMKEKQYVMATGGGPSESGADVDPAIMEIVPSLMSTAPTAFSSNFTADEIVEQQEIVLAEQRNTDVDMELNDHENNSNFIYRLNEIDDVVDETLNRPRPTRKRSNTYKADFDEKKLKMERIRRIMKNEEELAETKLRHEEIKNKLEIEFLKKKYELELRAAKAVAEKAELELKLLEKI